MSILIQDRLENDMLHTLQNVSISNKTITPYPVNQKRKIDNMAREKYMLEEIMKKLIKYKTKSKMLLI